MKTTSLLILSVFAFFVGCNPKYYSPNTQNVPLISEKGETNLAVTGNNNQIEFQGAYGITNHIAIKGNGGLFIPSDLDNGNGGSGKFFEVGGGYFNLVQNHFIVETYLILGLGSLENHLPSTVSDNPGTEGDISANVFRYGIQQNIGYKSTYFSAALSSRIVNLNYSRIQGDLIFEGISQTDYLSNNSSNLLLEPALTLRGGLENIKLQMQLGYSLNLSNTDFRQDNSYLSLGLNFNFN